MQSKTHSLCAHIFGTWVLGREGRQVLTFNIVEMSVMSLVASSIVKARSLLLATLEESNMHTQGRLKHNRALQHRMLVHPTFNVLEGLKNPHNRVRHLRQCELCPLVSTRHTLLSGRDDHLRCPIQILGPPLKGMYVQLLGVQWSHRSGAKAR